MLDVNETRSGQAGDSPVYRGRVVLWEGVKYRVLRRRAVDGLAMLQTDTHELFLAALDGGIDPEWVPENAVEPAGNEIEEESNREENIVGKKRQAVEPGRLDDGHYWYRNYINLFGGGHVDEWKMAQIIGGKFRQIGVTVEWEQDCEYLRNAVWVRVEPPHVEGNDGEAVWVETEVRPSRRAARDNRDAEHRLRERIRLLAEGIVDAFIETHDSTIVYYARKPEKRTELVAQIARLIRKVQQ